MKKLLIIIPTLKGGGMERVASELANYFSEERRLEVFIAMYGNKIGSNYTLHENIQLIKPNYDFDKGSRIINTIRALFFIRKTAGKIAPDVVLSFGEYWNSFVLLALLGAGKRVYISDRCQPDKSLGKKHDLFRRMLYPTAKGFIVQTGFAKEFFSMAIRQKNIVAIANPVRVYEAPEDAERENILLSVGRLIPSKNFDILIRNFSEINMPGWKLVIVGDNSNDPKQVLQLAQLVADLGLEGRVILAGHQSDVAAFYKRAKIFGFTSSSEGFPNVLLEAMSYGLPVVSYDISAGPSDIILHEKNGYLVKKFDNVQFNLQLKKLMNDDLLRKEFSERAIERAKEFSISRISEKYYDCMFDQKTG